MNIRPSNYRRWLRHCSESRKLGISETQKLGNSESRKFGSLETRKLGNSETQNLGSSETQKLGNSESLKIRNLESRKLDRNSEFRKEPRKHRNAEPWEQEIKHINTKVHQDSELKLKADLYDVV